jgi:anti-sigma regulatory factor (Ser/Thr protein kinase)
MPVIGRRLSQRFSERVRAGAVDEPQLGQVQAHVRTGFFELMAAIEEPACGGDVQFAAHREPCLHALARLLDLEWRVVLHSLATSARELRTQPRGEPNRARHAPELRPKGSIGPRLSFDVRGPRNPPLRGARGNRPAVTCTARSSYPRGPDAPRQARAALAEWYGDALGGEELDSGTLLVSELVTNAVVHGAGRIHLTADLDEDRLRVEVGDEGSGLERAARGMSFRVPRGHGLTIVGALSSRWGIREGTTHVWAEIERPGPPLGAEDKPGR